MGAGGRGRPRCTADLSRRGRAYRPVRRLCPGAERAGHRCGRTRPLRPRQVAAGGRHPRLFRRRQHLEHGGGRHLRAAPAAEAALSGRTAVHHGPQHGLLPDPDIPDPLSRHGESGGHHGHRLAAPGSHHRRAGAGQCHRRRQRRERHQRAGDGAGLRQLQQAVRPQPHEGGLALRRREQRGRLHRRPPLRRGRHGGPVPPDAARHTLQPAAEPSAADGQGNAGAVRSRRQGPCGQLRQGRAPDL